MNAAVRATGGVLAGELKIAMRKHFTGSTLALTVVALLASSFPLFAQGAPQKAPKTSDAANSSFDPHDLSGDWIGENTAENSRWANKTPEPPLTEWGKQNLLYKSITHDALSGTLRDPNKPPNDKGSVSGGDRNFYAADPNGVPANDPAGMYPGKGCEPLTAPAMFDIPFLTLLTIFETPEQIYLLNNFQREWRIFWLNREHPKDIDQTFEGDSVAHWDGNTLVVDTIGFNGRTAISGEVGHAKSDAFHLVERFTRVDHDDLMIDMTYADPKAWGDKVWTGFHKHYKYVPIEKVHDMTYKSDYFTEWICSPQDNKAFDQRVTDLATKH